MGKGSSSIPRGLLLDELLGQNFNELWTNSDEVRANSEFHRTIYYLVVNFLGGFPLGYDLYLKGTLEGTSKKKDYHPRQRTIFEKSQGCYSVIKKSDLLVEN